MIDTKGLKKIGDIINCEGGILELFTRDKECFLASHLNDGNGNVYYSTSKDRLQKYLNDDITLNDLYLGSNDLMVTKKFRTETSMHLKQDFSEKIQCGEQFYSELSEGMKSRDIGKMIDCIR